MPIVDSTFRPPVWLRNAHVQTILPAVLPRRTDVEFRRERLELPDGDFVDLDWAATGRGRLAVLSHGLEGNSQAHYIRGLAAALNRAGWDVLAWNYRGCSGTVNRCLRFYHSGATDDLAAVVDYAAKRYQRLALIGFSLGGNITLKYLGEQEPHRVVECGVAVSVPVHLDSCAQMLDSRTGNFIYRKRFLHSLRRKLIGKASAFPGELDVQTLPRVATIREYDERYTAPIHGFADAADYYARCSALQFLPSIRVPALLLNALDDPFLSEASFPAEIAAGHAHFHLEAPRWGGHVGFLDLRRGIAPWSEQRAVEFLREAGDGR